MNYSSLDDELKEVRIISLDVGLQQLFVCVKLLQLDDEGDVAKRSRELSAKAARLQSNLQRINAPNMKADEKYALVLSCIFRFRNRISYQQHLY